MSSDQQPLFQTVPLPEQRDVYAPDGSEIRLLSQTERGSMCHCTLPPQTVSLAGMHHNVEEIWYFLEGQGQVWRKGEQGEEVVAVFPGVSLSIPPHTHFQFRNASSEPLRLILTTMPPWPGENEWVEVTPHWPVEQ
ncbi:MAG TPA: cupin domain-containing protein [Dictyobacter sp.]|jgi:mannose-6-phosphate isomerase-like protein (cupin superfamily)|nr:cupin domain-containing protein [Dictyobacter sp.]